MELTVQKNNLQRAVGFVERVTSKNTALPILNNILLKTENGRLYLAATNLEVGIRVPVGAKIISNGQTAVPGRIFADVVRAARADTITLKMTGGVCTIDAGSHKTSVLCFDAGEYPIIPKVEGSSVFTIPADVLHSILNTVSDSIAVSETRPELSGAVMKFRPTETVIAATDSFRLVERRIPAKNKKEATVIVPRGTVMELLRVLPDIDGDITIHVAENQIAFTHDDFEVVSRLIDGRYPDYHKVIPEAFLAKALVRKDELENAAKVAALFSSSVSDIKIDCRDQKADITAKNSSKGEAQAAIEANIKGGPFDIALNYHYFLDGLKILGTEKIVMEFTGKGSPFVLRPNTDEKSTVYIIMPLRS